MSRCTLWLVMLPVAAGILGGCDSYSLPDQFALNGGLRLTPQTSSLKPGETTLLYLEGGTDPYSMYISSGGLFDDGTALDLGSLDDVGPVYSYTAGDSIGLVMVKIRDSLGFSKSATLSILPHAPASVLADGSYGGHSEVEISWTYPYGDKIEGFRILRSKDGAAFASLAGAGSLPASQTSFIDGDASHDGMNIYRVFAYAGSYQSMYGQDQDTGAP